MGLFRKKAIESLSTPEKLDQPIRLIQNSYWALLFSLIAFLIYIVIWGIFGKLPVRIYGKGIILTDNKNLKIQSQISGKIIELMYEENECLTKGDVLFIVDPILKKSRIKKLSSILNLMKSEDFIHRNSAKKLLEIEKEKNQRYQKLFQAGAVPKQSLDESEKALIQLESEIKLQQTDRNLKIKQKEEEIIEINTEINEKSIFKSNQDTCIIDKYFNEGEVVQAGDLIYRLSTLNNNNQLKSYAYFPVNDGKRLKVGQKVTISPLTTKPQRHGGIKGYVTSIRENIVSKKALMNRLGNTNFVEYVQFRNKNSGIELPLIEITTTLEKDINTKSGFDWGGGKGPNLEITKGTITRINVVAEERRPIEYIIPILRNLTGIY